MKNLFTSAVIIIALILSTTTQAQTNSPKLENSLLWEVSGNGLSKPTYLYGTIHMICSGDYFLSEKTKTAFDASDKLILEFNLDDPKEMTDMQQMVMGKQPLSKSLTPEQLTKLDAILKKSAGITLQQVDSFSLMSVMSLILSKSFECTDMKFYEMDFIASAKKRKEQIGGLETVKSQFKSFEDAYSVDEMIAMLEESDTELSKDMVVAYKQEKLEDLYEIITAEKVMNDKAKKYMLYERNINWVKSLPEMMKKESLFVAVGSAHLAGEEGLISLLRKAGYKVKPVTK
ncbi:TraB/GumN family protein [[Flexibacter] sp. ATCC 35103]|uniref:TraB/GumN family protein n=1 Tax=[Flexibacter] sp. ATCC 35103 TaxID=1937528 RepID=UPI0009CAFB03|nr:TraB/GumN family protein [[Flexibacter] sp. ATCC 35103]OMQ12535.1 TraB/GumN family protein [[Flexibacter] sp. ATCC 35103]